ncbi:MAG TPA: amino acid racemase [Selenomonadales bacterium]|nr:amino acid racemase [Selenomonadales bacterium]
MSKTVGILGGMGPLATVDLFAKIVENTPAERDQEHLRIIIDNHPQIPPRVEAALYGAESPLPAMIESARLLEKAGADFIVMPCNTAHYWLKELAAAVPVPVYDMIENAAEFIAGNHPEFSGKLLLLATGATVKLDLYQKAFAKKGLLLRLPAEDEQTVIDDAIKRVKVGELSANPYRDALNAMLDRYFQDGVKAIVGGCTEIPLLFPFLHDSLERFDATLLLARTVVKAARGA